jgi:hypothetical protein
MKPGNTLRTIDLKLPVDYDKKKTYSRTSDPPAKIGLPNS